MSELQTKIDNKISELKNCENEYNSMLYFFTKILEQIDDIIKCHTYPADDLLYEMFTTFMMAHPKSLENQKEFFKIDNYANEFILIANFKELGIILNEILDMDDEIFANTKEAIIRIDKIIQYFTNPTQETHNAIPIYKDFKISKENQDNYQAFLLLMQDLCGKTDVPKFYKKFAKRDLKGCYYYIVECINEIKHFDVKIAVNFYRITKDKDRSLEVLNLIRERLTKDMIDAIEDGYNLIQWIKKDNKFQEHFPCKQFFETAINIITTACEELKRKSNNYEKNKKQNFETLKKIKGFVKRKLEDQAYQNNYIELDDLDYSILDDELKKEFLIEVLNHNQKIVNQLSDQASKYVFPSYYLLEKLLIDRKINIHFSLEFLQTNQDNIENIKEMLDLIIEYKWEFCFQNIALLEQILSSSNPLILKDVKQKLDEYTIDENFLENNLEVLSTKYSIFVKNLKIWKKQRFTITNYDCLLLEDLEDRINLASLYLQNDKRFDASTVLNEPKFFDYFDQYIEYGFHELVTQNISLATKENANVIKRITIADSIKMPIVNNGKLIPSFLNEDSFLVPDAYLEDYLPATDFIEEKYTQALNCSNNLECDFNNNVVKEMDITFHENSYQYNIDEIIVSRLKVIRNLTTLRKLFPDDDNKDLVFAAICYNSLLQTECINVIHQVIYQKDLKLK